MWKVYKWGVYFTYLLSQHQTLRQTRRNPTPQHPLHRFAGSQMVLGGKKLVTTMNNYFSRKWTRKKFKTHFFGCCSLPSSWRAFLCPSILPLASEFQDVSIFIINWDIPFFFFFGGNIPAQSEHAASTACPNTCQNLHHHHHLPHHHLPLLPPPPLLLLLLMHCL